MSDDKWCDKPACMGAEFCRSLAEKTVVRNADWPNLTPLPCEWDDFIGRKK